MKSFVKAINKHGKEFKHFREQFPKVSDIKLKEAVFVGRQICEINNYDLPEQLLTDGN
jgi:hypothetical protein